MNQKQRRQNRHVFAQTFWQKKGLSIREALRMSAGSSQKQSDRKKLRLGQPLGK